MTQYNSQTMRKVISRSAAMLAAMLVGCATTNGTNSPLASIQIERSLQTSSGDCPVHVKIINRMKGTPWDGVSYHVALRNKNNVAIGELRGVPLRYTEPGYGLVVSSQIQGAVCEEIVGVSLLYFGYYPTGQGQVRLSNTVVTAEVK